MAGMLEELDDEMLSQDLLEALLKALLGIGFTPAAHT